MRYAVKRAMCYDYPIRDGFLAQVVLPYDLTGEEALRLGAFLKSLVPPSSLPVPRNPE